MSTAENPMEVSSMTEQNGTEEKSDRKSKVIIIILIILLLLALLFGGILLGILISGDDSFLTWLGITNKQQWGGLKVDVNAGEYVTPVINHTSQPGVAIPGWGTMTIPPGTTRITTVDFYNPEANNGTYYLTFELLIPKTGTNGEYESIYKSDLIPPGLHVQTINLTRPLSTGTYDAVIHVQPYRIADRSPTNNADMKTTLIVG